MTKIWPSKKHNKEAECINNTASELEGLEEGPKAEIHIELLKRYTKEISDWKTPGDDGIHGFWFKKFTSIHGKLALEMNRCLEDTRICLEDKKKRLH